MARKTPEQMLETLVIYQEDIDLAPERLSFTGKTLEKANKEQVTWLAYYDERKAELKTVVKRFQMFVEQERGKLFQLYTENYSRTLSDRVKDKYIDKDDEFLDMQEKLLQAEEVYEKVSAIVDAFKARGFALRNLVELKVHEVQDAIL